MSRRKAAARLAVNERKAAARLAMNERKAAARLAVNERKAAARLAVTSLIIADAGPLFAFAAADVLPALLHFHLVITDIVKAETIERGRRPGASAEAAKLHALYQAYADEIEVRETQLGALIAAAKRSSPRLKARNMGELSIQSLLIELAEQHGDWEAVVIFEDAWFLRHGASLPANCQLIGTAAFLQILERLQLIESAAAALDRIRRQR